MAVAYYETTVPGTNFVSYSLGRNAEDAQHRALVGAPFAFCPITKRITPPKGSRAEELLLRELKECGEWTLATLGFP